MMFHSDDFYPPSVEDILDPEMKFKQAALRALRNFRDAKPWSGTEKERMTKFRDVIRDLAAAYGIEPPQIDFTGVDPAKDSGASAYIPAFHAIYLRGRLSVVTLLHEFGHALGKGEWGATKWSVNMYRRIWPREFAKCRADGHMLRRH